MRLITHNMLQCHVKGCTENNFPLRIEEPQLAQNEVEFNDEFMSRLLSKLDWPALLATAKQLDLQGLPEQLPENPSEEDLKRIHSIILETSVTNGKMICNNCGHVYPIVDCIPNMLLSEHEV